MSKKTIYSFILGLSLFFSSAGAFAKTCWDLSAEKHGLDAWLLFAIASVESEFSEGITATNTNKSTDIGIMQINSIHLPYFAKLGYTRHELQYDSCKNIMAAGYLLKASINRYGLNIHGIGGYHSNTPHLRIAYGRKVLNRYKELTQAYGNNRSAFSFQNYRATKVSHRKPSHIKTPTANIQYMVTHGNNYVENQPRLQQSFAPRLKVLY